MLIDKLNKYVSYFKDDMYTELRSSENRKRLVRLVNGNLITNLRTDESGVCSRVYKNGLCGFASLPEYDDESIKYVLKKADENVLFMNKYLNYNIPNISTVQNGNYNSSIMINDIDQKSYIDFVKELDNYIMSQYPDIKSRKITAIEDSMEKILYVSNGYNAHTKLPRSYIYIALCTETKEGMPIELMSIVGGLGIFSDNFNNYSKLYKNIDKLYVDLMKKREGIHAEAGYKTVILGGDLSGMLAHEAVGHTVEADLVTGGSVAGYNLNKRVGSDLVSLVDFAHTAFGEIAPLPVYIDDEGTKAEDCVIIENGILKEYMNNKESAVKYDMIPRGNARAFCYSDEPIIRMRNTAILPGENTLEDMIASVEDGYYLCQSPNGQADTTGEFMFGISKGYEIKNGKLGKAILDTTISGVAFDMLKTVDMVSNNITWSSSGFCGKKQIIPTGIGGPEIRCKVMIGGK